MNKKFRGYLIGAVLGLLIGAIFYFVQPIKWKGMALVKVGHISQGASQNLIEPLGAVTWRLKSHSFIQSVAERAKKVEIVKLLSPDEDAGMAIKNIEGGGALAITVQGGSAALVRDSLDSLATELIFKHDAIINAYQVDILSELAELDAEKAALSKNLGMVVKGHALEAPFIFSVLTIDIWYKLNQSAQLRESISSANIRPTSLMDDITVTEKRMFSSLWRASLFGALLGIILSAIWIRWEK